MKIKSPLFTLVLLLVCCSVPETGMKLNIYQEVSRQTFIEGKPQYLTSPFVTAGDRVYLIGHQDGSFPDLGWHVTGEMGGIWDHPIKLMDGFVASIKIENSEEVFCLDKADSFINYPMANVHHFAWASENMEVYRTQFVPDSIEGMIVEFRIVNNGNEKKEVTFSFTGQSDLRPTWLGERTEMIDAEDEIKFDESAAAVIAKDKDNPWFVLFGSSLEPKQYSNVKATCETLPRKGLGQSGTLMYSMSIGANGEVRIPFFIAGSYQSE
jgi:hypothetical protein